MENIKGFNYKGLIPINELETLFTQHMIGSVIFAVILLILGIHSISTANTNCYQCDQSCECGSKIWLWRYGVIKVVFAILMFCLAGYFSYQLKK